MEKTRTMAFQVPEETFQRLKDYLKRHKVKQRAFVVGLVEAALDKDEAVQQSAQDGNGKGGNSFGVMNVQQLPLAIFFYNNLGLQALYPIGFTRVSADAFGMILEHHNSKARTDFMDFYRFGNQFDFRIGGLYPTNQEVLINAFQTVVLRSNGDECAVRAGRPNRAEIRLVLRLNGANISFYNIFNLLCVCHGGTPYRFIT